MYFLLLLLWFNFSSCSELTPTLDIIFLKMDSNSTYSTEVRAPIMYLGEKIEIKVHTENVTLEPETKIIQFSLTTHTCRGISADTFLNSDLHKCIGKENCYSTDSIIVTHKMSAKWQYKFAIDGKGYFSRPFDVQVRSPFAGLLYINGKQRESLSESDRYRNLSYDRYTDYTYVDGEMAKFECKTNQGIQTLMIYKDKEQQIVIPEKKRSSMIELKLNKSNKPLYLDCITQIIEPSDEDVCLYNNTVRVFFLSTTLGQNVYITPREAVRKVGDDLEVLCKVPYLIDLCRMTVGTTSYRLIPGQQEGDVVYYGQGLQSGECGAHIKNIREYWNGNISCVLPSQSGSIEIAGTMKLTVAKPPQNPILLSPPQPNFREGEIFTAQCIAADGRPAARISWLIDEEDLLTGVHQPIITSAPGSDLQTISQNISRTLVAEDGGRTITCRVEQDALTQPREVRRQLVVYYPPKGVDPSITIFGLKLNEEGRLNVTVRSNPAPLAEWSVGEHRLVAPQTSDDGAIAALSPLHLGGGYYNVTLVLSRVQKEDVERSYYLRLSNELGGEEVVVRISTMEEPADSATNESRTAIIATVAIVIAILAIIIIAAFCFVPRLKKLRRDINQQEGEGGVACDQLEATTSGNDIGTLYESVDYDAINVRSTAPNIRERPPQPPPKKAPASEEDHYHYDSTYDWRIAS